MCFQSQWRNTDQKQPGEERKGLYFYDFYFQITVHHGDEVRTGTQAGTEAETMEESWLSGLLSLLASIKQELPGGGLPISISNKENAQDLPQASMISVIPQFRVLQITLLAETK